MKPSFLTNKLFIDKTLSTLLLLILAFGGVMAYQSMVRENNPDLAIPSALIQVDWPGAAAEQVEKEITKPLEDDLKGLKGLKKLDSGSLFSASMVTVEFNADIAIPSAMQALRAKVDEASAKFPKGAKKPIIEQVSVSDTPVLEFLIYGDVDEYSLNSVSKKIAKRLEAHPLVRKAEKSGFRDTSVHIRMIPQRLDSLSLSPLVVQQRIEQANRDLSWGEFDSGDNIYELYYAGRFDSIDKLKKLPVFRTGDNRVILLEEVAHVYQGLDRSKTETYFSQAGEAYKKGISIAIKKNSGADTITLVNEVKQLMEELRYESFWPQGLKSAVVSDESVLIEQSFSDIFNNIWQAMLAVFVILMVLLTWREAIIAGLAIPLTFAGTLLVLWMTGSTLNTMVIIGMVLALGLLVDVFILVMEGMHEHIYVKGLSFAESAIGTVKTYAVPAFSGQLTTVLAMVPMMAIGGTDGKFIRLIPVTGVLCLVFSYIIAFTVAIPLSQHLLKPGKENTISKMDKLAKTVGQKLKNWLLSYALASKKQAFIWVTGAVVIWVGSLQLFSTLPSLLYPKADGRNLAITIRLAPDATLEQSRLVAEKAGDYLSTIPYFQNTTMYVGKRSPRAVGSLNEEISLNTSYNLVGFSVLFTPKDDREKLAFEYVDEIRTGLEAHLADVPGLTVTFKPETGGSSNDDPLQLVIRGPDISELRKLANQVEIEIAKVNGVTDVRNNLGYFKSQVKIFADGESLSFHGITEDQFSAQLRLATEADEIGKFKMPGTDDDLKIRLSTYWESRGSSIGGPKDDQEISMLNIYNDKGTPVLLEDLIDYEVHNVPSVYIHKNGQRSITVMGKVNGITVGEVIETFEPVLAKLKQQWPAGYDYYYSGEAESSAETYGSAGIAFVFAIFLVFAVLTLSLGSFRQAMVIIFTIPLALIGTFTGFWLLNLPFSFPAMIGLISLIGIVVNNAIVMVDTMNTYRDSGVNITTAAANGAADRLRPIVGTTITTLVGLVPLALSDPMWFPLCMAIIFGLLASTMVAMVVVPSMYLLVSKPVENAA